MAVWFSGFRIVFMEIPAMSPVMHRHEQMAGKHKHDEYKKGVVPGNAK